MKLIAPLLFLAFIYACGNDNVIEQVDDSGWTKDESINMNSTFAEEEDAEIDSYLSRRPDWKVTRSGTGLRSFIYHKSEFSDTAKVGDAVLVDFSVELLDGTICYTSEKEGPESFIVEKADIESGLHEAMQLMCTGDKGKFILPSFMAHGLIGDEDKIPPLTPVIYDIHLIEIQHAAL
ncbi:MAG: FKBP-type peptidyl-prolyl cis-trans isomerase [Crocinitomicaceae bacterium]